MKKNLKALLVTLMLICVVPTGCIKDPDGNNPLNMIPDLTNFTIEAVSTWKAGANALVSIVSTSIGSGEFTVHFNLTGANVMTGLTAILTMNGSSGTFQTPVMANSGQTNVVITSITNSSGGSANTTTNNTYTFADSTGLMTATMAGSPFRATNVKAHWLISGGLLTINATKFNPLSAVTLYVDNWTGSATTINFNAHNSTSFLGSAAYSPGAHLSEHGTIPSLLPRR